MIMVRILFLPYFLFYYIILIYFIIHMFFFFHAYWRYNSGASTGQIPRLGVPPLALGFGRPAGPNSKEYVLRNTSSCGSGTHS